MAVPQAGTVDDADVVTEFIDLLSSGDMAEECAGGLREGQRERGLVFGGRPLCVALRPQLISRSRYRRAMTACRTIRGALDRLERALVADADLRSELDLDPVEEELALADTGSRFTSPSVRIDGFFSDELRFVEYNAESPAGIAYSDALSGAFGALPAMRQLRQRYRLTPLPVAARQLAAMRHAFQEWGRAEQPVLAIVDLPGVPTIAEFEMFRELFERAGIRALICEPSTLEYRGGSLFAGDERVNIVYRRVLTTELLAAGHGARALRDAYLDGAACVVNSFRAKLLHKKMSLSLLSDERYASLFTPGQCEAIARHIPWTRKLRDGPATRSGEPIADLVAHVVEHREELVLKPNDEYGGEGVVLGWTVDAGAWAQALKLALDQSYVVQEAVEIPWEQFPISFDSGVEVLRLAVDMNPYLFEGRPAGCLSRLSSSELLNVTAGTGSVVPTYVVEGRR
ncbi:MAG: hypothetical protein ABR600_04565 [Actinomycetota bacterium]